MTYTVTVTRDDTLELVTLNEDSLPNALCDAAFAMKEEPKCREALL